VIGTAPDASIDELGDLPANGNIVELGELGFLSTSLKGLRETDYEMEIIRSESVQFRNVYLRISSTFRNTSKQQMTLELVHSDTKKSKKAVETTEATRKAGLEPFLKRKVCINANRIDPIERADQTTADRRTEQIHPARLPAPPRDGKVNGLCAPRRRHSKRKLGAEPRGTKTQKPMLYPLEKHLGT
jgi:hypothetical protein